MNLHGDVSSLPRLLYLGDVPVQNSVYGSVFLYRLLENYPPEQLLILEPRPWPSQRSRRLSGVNYISFSMGWAKLANSRFADVYGSWILRTIDRLEPRIASLLDGFQPEAVLTVTHGYSWLAAAKFATRYRLPLHLICHDDWLLGLRTFKWMTRRADELFERYYGMATSRLCVSPRMVDYYRERYHVDGRVLYPFRAKDCTTATAPGQKEKSNGSLVFAFAGTINSEGYAKALRELAGALEMYGGKLFIYGPLTISQAEAIGLIRKNIIVRGFVKDLIGQLREETDVLFVPMSFSSDERSNMEISFPSKLADYTAVGVPLLIYGPAYSSAIRWAKENEGVAEIVEAEGQTALGAAVDRLVRSDQHRQQLGTHAVEIGQRYFSHATASETFLSAIQTISPPDQPQS